VMLGIIPAEILAKSSSPFADCLTTMFNSPKIGVIVSIIAIADVLGAMGGWCLVTGQTAQLAASDGLFPKIFAKTNSRDMPSNGLIIMASFMSLVVLLTASITAQAQFNKIISMSVLLYLIPYIYSNIALIILGRKNKLSRGYFILATVAGIFFIWSIYLTNITLLKYAMMVIVMSIPIRSIFKK
ncbi:MAG: amino acid permease, partial [Burkholderiales bacterium]|nr:amino acid permease [Burkholderiales bacterium]